MQVLIKRNKMWTQLFIFGCICVWSVCGATIRPKIQGIPVNVSQQDLFDLEHFVGRRRPDASELPANNRPPLNQGIPVNIAPQTNPGSSADADPNNRPLPEGAVERDGIIGIMEAGDIRMPLPDFLTFEPPTMSTEPPTTEPTLARGDITFEIPTTVYPDTTTTDDATTTMKYETTTTERTESTTNPVVTTDPTPEIQTTQTQTTTVIPETTSFVVPTWTTTGATTVPNTVEPTTTEAITTEQTSTETETTTTIATITDAITTTVEPSTFPPTTAEQSTISTYEPVSSTTQPATTDELTTQEITTETTTTKKTTTSVPETSTAPPTQAPQTTPGGGVFPIFPDDDFEFDLDDDFWDDFELDDGDDGLGWNFWLGGGDDADDDFNWWGGAGDEDRFMVISEARTASAEPKMAKDMNQLKTVPIVPEQIDLVKDDDVIEDIDRVLDTMYFNTKSWLHVVNEGGQLNKRTIKQLRKFDNMINSVYKRISKQFLNIPALSRSSYPSKEPGDHY